ncbi:MAG: hypothetical protein RRA92_10745 [Gemmatimonadota bacterium]|nr:hypothetical protein [Gemmatimonadota bacterium]
MRTHLIRSGIALFAIAALGACSDDATDSLAPDVQSGLDEAQVQAVALELDEVAADLVDGSIAEGEAGLTGQVTGFSAMIPPMFGSGTDEVAFTRTRTCALAGEVVIEGTLLRTWEAETRHVSVDVRAVKTHMECTFPLPASTTDAAADPLTITLNGDPNVAINAHREREGGFFVGLQTMSHVGQIAWAKSDGTSGVCEVDIQVVLDPEARTRTVTGTLCGRTIDRTWTWDRRHHGPHGGGN